MDGATFGGGPCADRLAENLTQLDDAHLIAKVTNLVHETRRKVKLLREGIPDATIRAEMLLLLRDATLPKSDKVKGPEQVRTRLRNILVAIFRDALRHENTHARGRRSAEALARNAAG